LINGRDEPPPSSALNNSNITYYNIVISSNALSNIFYVLSNASSVLVRGQLFPSSVEQYTHVPENATLFLVGFSDKYYFNMSKCFVHSDKQLCRISLKPKAVDYTVAITPELVTIDPKNGTIQAPIILCFSYDSTITNVLTSLRSVPVPIDLKTFADLCYVYDKDISKPVSIPINIHKNEYNNVEGVLQIICRDHEQDGYSAIGDKKAGLRI
jgi:hypothetical protein